MNYFSIYSLSRGISQHICCHGLLLLHAPSSGRNKRVFFLWWGFFQKSSHPNHFSICGKGWKWKKRQSIDPQSAGIRMRMESATSHTSSTKVMMPRTSGRFLRPPSPSVKINKITIKKISLLWQKPAFSSTLPKGTRGEGESQLYQKWELIFDWIYGGKNCFKGGEGTGGDLFV